MYITRTSQKNSLHSVPDILTPNSNSLMYNEG